MEPIIYMEVIATAQVLSLTTRIYEALLFTTTISKNNFINNPTNLRRNRFIFPKIKLLAEDEKISKRHELFLQEISNNVNCYCRLSQLLTRVKVHYYIKYTNHIGIVGQLVSVQIMLFSWLYRMITLIIFPPPNYFKLLFLILH